jgi:membrane associated rhomboid family serine protease
MRRYPSAREMSYSFGPGPLPPAVKALIAINVGVFILLWILPESIRQGVIEYFGLIPAAIFQRFHIWQPVTYMFLHSTRGIGHVLVNMLMLWMFGTELEQMWGTRAFLKYYFATGVAAAVSTVLISLVPLAMTAGMFNTPTIGASGAIYGLLLAYGLAFPRRPILMFFVFPVPARYFVMIMGGIALLSSIGESGGNIAHITHLGGLVGGYLILRGRHFHPVDDARYWYLRWKMDRAKKKFGVHTGGRNDRWDKRIH